MIDWKNITIQLLTGCNHGAWSENKNLRIKVMTIDSKYHPIHESLQTIEHDDLFSITIANFHTLSLKQTHSCKSPSPANFYQTLFGMAHDLHVFLAKFFCSVPWKWSARSYMDWIRKSRKLQTARTHKDFMGSTSKVPLPM